MGAHVSISWPLPWWLFESSIQWINLFLQLGNICCSMLLPLLPQNYWETQYQNVCIWELFSHSKHLFLFLRTSEKRNVQKASLWSWTDGMQCAHQPYLFFKVLFLAAMIWQLQINTHQFPVLFWSPKVCRPHSMFQPLEPGGCFAWRHQEWQHTIMMWHDTKTQQSREWRFNSR